MKRVLMSVLVLITAIALLGAYKSQDLKRAYKTDVQKALEHTDRLEPTVLTEKDIAHLPEPVRKYLTYTGAVGRKKVLNFRGVFEGEMRLDPDKGWMKIHAEQYNFFDDPTRMFYITGIMNGVPVPGLHAYKDATAIMKIKLLGLLTVADAKGPEMNQGETVTILNDMCFWAPASLIDNRIQWETIDPLTVKAVFTNGKENVSATLYFNKEGQLINFVSYDRFMTGLGDGSYQNLKWSTPANEYGEMNGMRLARYGEAIWTLPDGSEYSYGRFRLKECDYNIKLK